MLAASIAYNVYDSNNRTTVISQLEETLSYVRGNAFFPWLENMANVSDILSSATTRLDVRAALSPASAALDFANILDWTIEIRHPSYSERQLYSEIAVGTYMLNQFLNETAKIPATNVTTLDRVALRRIGNFTATFSSIENLAGGIAPDSDPFWYLTQKGCVDQFTTYCHDITGSLLSS